MKGWIGRITGRADILWFLIWITGLAVLGLWDAFFLNPPAFALVRAAFTNTLFVCTLVLALSLLLGWSTGLLLYFLERRRPPIYLAATFGLNLLRSIPQIVGALIGYVVLTVLLENGHLAGKTAQLLWMTLGISLLVFHELADRVRERITY